MIRNARMRGRRGLGVSIPPGFSEKLGIGKDDTMLVWWEDQKLFYSKEIPDETVQATYNAGISEGAIIVTLPPKWIAKHDVTSTQPLDVSLKGNCIIVQIA